MPPSTSAICTEIERSKPSTSSAMYCVVSASSAPATPAIAAEMVKAIASCMRTPMPSAGTRRTFSRMPFNARPNGEFTSRRASR